MDTHIVSELAWERMVSAVEKVRERLRRAVDALERSRIPYAVVGGNAVAALVSEVDESAVRNTRGVDILLRRQDLERAKEAFSGARSIYRHPSGVDMFLDGPGARARDAIHIVFAGEKVRPEYELPAPEVGESRRTGTFQVVNLDALVRMKLTSFRRADQVHVLDLIQVGLVDASWLNRVPQPLAERLQELLDNPEE
jgi:hypothetical protein